MLIDPDAFEASFVSWVRTLSVAFDREVVAIDGKTLRRSFDRGRDQTPLHVVSAWAEGSEQNDRQTLDQAYFTRLPQIAAA